MQYCSMFVHKKFYTEKNTGFKECFLHTYMNFPTIHFKHL